MGGIRQCEFHVVPLIRFFLKLVTSKDVCLDFRRVERNVVEFTIKFRFKPKPLASNQLTSNAQVVINHERTRGHKGSLEMSTIASISRTRLKRHPFHISRRIEQKITRIVRIRDNRSLAQIKVFPRLGCFVPSSFVINIDNLNSQVIGRIIKIKAIP